MSSPPKKKPRFCPMCQTQLVLSYPKAEPHRWFSPLTEKWRIPMRCPTCVRDITVTVDPKDLKEDEEL